MSFIKEYAQKLVTAEEAVCKLAETTRFFSFSACALNFALLMR